MSLLAPLLLSLLPSQLTHLLLPRLTASFPALFPPSPRGSLIYARNYKLVFTLLVGSYVVWTFFVDGNVEEGEEWYSLLEVKRDVDDEALRKAFRRLSRTHHPDRAGISHSNKFIILRQAYETLSDPLTRYAYDRFGPQVMSWKGKTVGDYLKRGLANASGFYLVSSGVMVLLSILGRAKGGASWRITFFFILLLSELTLILSPTPSLHSSPLFNLLPPPFSTILRFLIPRSALEAPQWVQISWLHRGFASASIALSQLADVWGSRRGEEWETVVTLARGVEAEAVATFQDTVIPVLAQSSNPMKTEIVIQRSMQQVLVDRALSSHPSIRESWAKAVLRQRNLHSNKRKREAERLLMVATTVPLPLSPPSSPQLGPYR